MGRYVNRPDQGSIQKIHVVERIVEKHADSQQSIHIGDLANAVAQALSSQMPKFFTKEWQNNSEDSFDNTNTLEQLANSMTVQRNKNDSNFKDLGNIKKSKKNSKETNSIIDMLSSLDE
jgi:hypothetical protein